jgi:hypothetical protein
MTADKLLEVSAKAKERTRCGNEGHALVTAQNAAGAAERCRRVQGVKIAGEETTNMLAYSWRNPCANARRLRLSFWSCC